MLCCIGIFSCSGGVCDKPNENRGKITIPIDLVSSASGCQISGSKLLSDFKAMGNNTFGKSLKNDPSKWVIEFFVAGDCGPNTVWNQLYKFGDWKPSVSTINGVEYFQCEIPDLPTKNGDLSVDMTIYSPCINCNNNGTQGSFRSFFPKSTRISSPNGPGTIPREQIQFSSVSECK